MRPFSIRPGYLSAGMGLQHNLMREGKCACGANFTGPPNQKRCPGCKLKSNSEARNKQQRRAWRKRRAGNGQKGMKGMKGMKGKWLTDQ